MTKSCVVNSAIVNSIPLEKSLKRYFVKWYRDMVTANGQSFASSRMKDLREVLLSYRSDPNRVAKRKDYIQLCPIRKNHRLYQLFQYADSHPHAVLSFLKLYLGPKEPEISYKESCDSMHELLSRITTKPGIPQELVKWLNLLTSSSKTIGIRYHSAKSNPIDPYHYVASHHSFEQWMSYWTTWRQRLLKTVQTENKKSFSLSSLASEYVPTPSLYSGDENQQQKKFSDDISQFFEYLPDFRDGEITVPLDALDLIIYELSQDKDQIFAAYELDELFGEASTPLYVGEIHHIPKKGTVSRRPIAAPNRVLQYGLVPFGELLYRILRKLPRDHTFSQRKSVPYIQDRLDNRRYVCSVDLSKATDYLPKSVGDYILDSILPDNLNENIQVSRDLFDYMSRAPWKNGEHLSSWKVGQPLGTLPSFGMLGITHNILLEALALSAGYLHSPYTVLGDDVLLFSKRMRRIYIDTMDQLGVPLSLHKSYEHNLVEFAGLVMIANQPARYCPDHQTVNRYNLFDWSRNAGYLLSYSELPSSIQKWLTRKAAKVSLTGGNLYRLAAELYFATYWSGYDSYMDLSMEVLPTYISLIQDRVLPDHDTASGWNTVIGPEGTERLIHLARTPVRNERKLLRNMKYKPLSTTAIIRSAMDALRVHNEQRVL